MSDVPPEGLPFELNHRNRFVRAAEGGTQILSYTRDCEDATTGRYRVLSRSGRSGMEDVHLRHLCRATQPIHSLPLVVGTRISLGRQDHGTGKTARGHFGIDPLLDLARISIPGRRPTDRVQ